MYLWDNNLAKRNTYILIYDASVLTRTQQRWDLNTSKHRQERKQWEILKLFYRKKKKCYERYIYILFRYLPSGITNII